MKDFRHIEQEIDQTLKSVDMVKSASPGPFFFTRVQARLARTEKNLWERMGMLVSRPAVVIAGICFIIIINTVTVLDFKDITPSLADQNEPIYDEEYNMAVTSFYYIENTEP